jgi:hypothetical protein
LRTQVNVIPGIDFRLRWDPENHGITLAENEPHLTDDTQVLCTNAKRPRMQASAVNQAEPYGNNSRIRFCDFL